MTEAQRADAATRQALYLTPAWRLCSAAWLAFSRETEVRGVRGSPHLSSRILQSLEVWGGGRIALACLLLLCPTVRVSTIPTLLGLGWLGCRMGLSLFAVHDGDGGVFEMLEILKIFGSSPASVGIWGFFLLLHLIFWGLRVQIFILWGGS